MHRKASEIFNDALDIAPPERGVFLERMCAGDPSLRAEVDSLFAIYERHPPPPANHEVASTPEQVGRYKVLGELGRGGMGRVLLAEDPTLGRRIAVKVLPAHLVNAPGSFARLRREAQILARLNHPNIATLFSLEQADDHEAFLTMEWVTGDTLSTRLSACPAGEGLHTSLVLRIGLQIAAALEAAHDHGIVHRDLKPANVAITASGQVKVLDFGLAKVVAIGFEEAPTTNATDDDASSSSARAGETLPGSILGSPGYMSPERIRGEPAGPSSDLWALGCVLFECFAGRPAFPGATPHERLSTTLEDEPDWSALPADVPDEARELLRQCLVKDPERRIASAFHLRTGLEHAAARASGAAGAPRASHADGVVQRIGHSEPRPRGLSWLGATRRRRLAGLAAVAAIAALSIWLAVFRAETQSIWPESRTSASPNRQVTFSGRVTEFDLSPDERAIVYATSSGAIVSRDLATGEEEKLHQVRRVWRPRWSPSGEEILFTTPDSFGVPHAHVVSMSTGAVRRIGPAAVITANWTSDGRPIGVAMEYLRGGGSDRLLLVDLSSRDTTSIPMSPEIRVLRGLSFSPTDSKVAFWGVAKDGSSGVWVAPDMEAPVHRVSHGLPAGEYRWSRSGDALLYISTQDGTRVLLRCAVDAGAGVITGQPEIVASLSQWATDSVVLRDGRVFYLSRQVASTVWLQERDPVGSWSRRPLASGSSAYSHPRLSPDGQRVAVCQVADGAQSIVLVSVADGSSRKLHAGVAFAPSWTAWSPDGRKIAFRAGIENPRVWIVDVESGAMQPASSRACGGYVYWSPADRIHYQPAEDLNKNYMVLDAATGTERPLLSDARRGTIFQSAFSPDGRWLAVAGNRNDVTEVVVWLIDLVDGTERLLYDRSAAPIGWSRDGSWVYAVFDESDESQFVESAHVIRISVFDGAVESVVDLPPGVLLVWANAEMAPDGDRVVSAVSQRMWDIWLTSGGRRAHGI